MAIMRLEIVTPDRKFFTGEVKGVKLKGLDGLFEILPRHTELVASLVPAEIKIKTVDGDKYAFISSGFVEVSNRKLSLLLMLLNGHQKLTAKDVKKLS